MLIMAENGLGFKNLLANVKEINKKRRISTYKNPVLQFNAQNPFLKKMCESIDLMQGSHLVKQKEYK
jgi:hypothetical protein